MPFSPDESSTDKLLKYLEIELRNAFTTDELRRLGWFQFRRSDHPGTLVTTELAAAAFIYLSFEADGAWRRNVKVVVAVLAFLGRYYGQAPRPNELEWLKTILEAGPLDRAAVLDWFSGVYPPRLPRPNDI